METTQPDETFESVSPAVAELAYGFGVGQSSSFSRPHLRTALRLSKASVGMELHNLAEEHT